MDTFQRAEEIVADNRESFEEFADAFRQCHGIPHEIVMATVKRMLISQLNRETPARFFSPYHFVASLTKFVGAMGYFAVRAVFGGAHPAISADVLFEAFFENSYCDFYQEIDADLSHWRTGVLVTAPNAPVGLPAHAVVAQRSKQLAFSRRPARRLLRTHFLAFPRYWRLVRRTGLDFVDLALRLMRQIATHETEAENVAARFLVSAGDNHYSALRYCVYRRCGIERVMLLQNGGRVDLTAGYSSHIYCDYYVGWSQKRLDAFRGMVCPNRLPLGSIRQARTGLGSGAHVEPEVDLVFIEQIIGTGSVFDSSHAHFLVALDNFCRLALEFPALRAVYRLRHGRYVDGGGVQARAIDKILTAANIVTDADGNSYAAIARTRLVIACDSSMRVEALAMGRFVLSCNYAQTPFDFVAGDPKELGALFDNSYEAFRDRVLYILNDKNQVEVRAYYARKQAELGGLPGAPSRRVARLIDGELRRLPATELPGAAGVCRNGTACAP